MSWLANFILLSILTIAQLTPSFAHDKTNRLAQHWADLASSKSSGFSSPFLFSSTASLKSSVLGVFDGVFRQQSGTAWSSSSVFGYVLRQFSQRGVPSCDEMHQIIFKPEAYEDVMWTVTQIPYDRVCGYSTPGWAGVSSVCIASGTAENSFSSYSKSREQQTCCCDYNCLLLSFSVKECESCPTIYVRLLLIKSRRQYTSGYGFCAPSPTPYALAPPPSAPSPTPTPFQCTQPTQSPLSPKRPPVMPTAGLASPPAQPSTSSTPSASPAPLKPFFTATPSPTPRGGTFTPSRRPVAAIINIVSPSEQHRIIVRRAVRQWGRNINSWIPLWKYNAKVEQINGNRYRVIFRFKEQFASQWVP